MFVKGTKKEEVCGGKGHGEYCIHLLSSPSFKSNEKEKEIRLVCKSTATSIKATS